MIKKLKWLVIQIYIGIKISYKLNKSAEYFISLLIQGNREITAGFYNKE